MQVSFEVIENEGLNILHCWW